MPATWGGSEQGRSKWWASVTDDEPSGCVSVMVVAASVVAVLAALIGRVTS